MQNRNYFKKSYEFVRSYSYILVQFFRTSDITVRGGASVILLYINRMYLHDSQRTNSYEWATS